MSARKPVTVVIGTPCTLFREGVKALLLSGAAIQVIGEAANAKQTISVVERLKPDVVLMDPDMPDLDAIETVRRISNAVPGVRVLMMPVQDGHTRRPVSLRSGVAGYIGKHDRPRQLRSAVLLSYRRGAHAA